MIRFAAIVPHPPLLIPNVGRGEERKVEKTGIAYKEMAASVKKRNPARVVLISSHVTRYADYFHLPPEKKWSGSFRAFGDWVTELSASGDPAFLARLTSYEGAHEIPYGTAGATGDPVDHASLVPLYFLQEVGVDCPVIRVGTSGLPYADHYRLGQYIKRAAQESEGETVVIASGDLSHKLKDSGPYGYDPAGPAYDKKVMNDLSRADFGNLLRYEEAELEAAAHCGHPTFAILAGALDGLSVRVLSSTYEGPFGVGYGVVTYEVGDEDPSRRFLKAYEKEMAEKRDIRIREEHPYVRLARETIENKLLGKKRPEISADFPQDTAAVFVTLHKFGQLRGCIGTLSPRYPQIEEEIRHNAKSAAFEDPRFHLVSASEIPYLEISVDVLSVPEPIDSMSDLDPKKYGVIVKKGYKSGVLLPDLEGIDTAEQQVAIAKRKAGIGETEKPELERFLVTRYG